MKFKIFTLSIILCICCITAHAQLHLDWAYNIGGKLSDYAGYMKADYADNLYEFAEYQDSTDLDHGLGTDWVYPKSSNAMVLSKINRYGQFQWSVRFYDGYNVYGSIFEIKNNVIRISLTFSDSLVYEFHGQSTTLFKKGGVSTCLMNLDLDGHIVDSHLIQSTRHFYFTDIITLSNGNTLLSGSFLDSMSFDPQTTYYSKGKGDAFVAMMDKQYKISWITFFSTPENEYLDKIYVRDSRIYFAVRYADTISVQTPVGWKTFPSKGKDDALYGYLNMSGEIQKIFSFGGDDYDQIRSIAVDQNNFMYIGGYFGGIVNFANPGHPAANHTSTGSWDAFLAKYNSVGDLVWVKTFDNTYYTRISSIDLIRGNELYITGEYTSKADLDPGPDSIIVETDNQTDIFISKFNTNGDLKWSYALPGQGYEGAEGIHVSTENSKFFLTGSLVQTLDCDPSSEEYTLNSYGSSDIFYACYSEDNVLTVTDGPSFVGEPLDVIVAPNPTPGKVKISSDDEIHSIMIEGMDGKIIRSFTMPGYGSEVNLTDLPSGMYFITLMTENKSVTRKIIKE